MIQDLEGIHCEKCGKFIHIGEDAYNIASQVLCESCFDKYQEEEKNDCAYEVNNYNFDLEKEV